LRRLEETQRTTAFGNQLSAALDALWLVLIAASSLSTKMHTSK
jgi:hypothetical protein